MRTVVKVVRFEFSKDYPTDSTDEEILEDMGLQIYDAIQHLGLDSFIITEEAIDDGK